MQAHTLVRSLCLLASLPILVFAVGCQKQNRQPAKLDKQMHEFAAELERQQQELDAQAVKEDAAPAEKVPTDRASVLAELHRVGARITTAGDRPDGPVVKLTLMGKEVTNKTLAYVAALPHLEELTLDDATVTDRGLGRLQSLKKLRSLSVGFRGPPVRGRITDIGLAHIAGLPSLERLFLGDTKITDRGVESCLGHLRKLKSLELSRARLTSRWLPALEECDRLSELSLAVMPVGDSGLEALGRVKNLTSLRLRSMAISEAGIAAMGKLRGLRRLDLAFTNVNDAALRQLAALGNLEELYLANTQITGEGVVFIRGMTGLRELDLTETAVGDAGLRSLRGLAGLRDLSLDRTRITNKGLAHLAALKKLETLGLSNTAVTDAGVAALVPLTGLRLVRLTGTRVSAQKVKELEQARPELNVVKLD